MALKLGVAGVASIGAGAAALVLLACLGAGCVGTVPGDLHQDPPKEYRAYGKTWKFVLATRYDQRYWLHPLSIGGDSKPKDLLYLYKADSSRIELHERIYALQRDGSYKKVECCTGYGGLNQPIIGIDDKLVLQLQAPKENVTDCYVYPPNAPDNEKRSPAERITVVDFLGEFDPVSERVLLNSFFPGVKDRGDKAGTSSATMQDYYRVVYANRRPFN
jgi:hypothetical protein